MHKHIHRHGNTPVSFTESINTSLNLLRFIEQTVDMLASIERLLEEVTNTLNNAVKGVENFDDELPDINVQIEQFDISAGMLANRIKQLFNQRDWITITPLLGDDDRDYMLNSTNRIIDAFKRALDATERMKWALMENQAEFSERMGQALSVDELIKDLNK